MIETIVRKDIMSSLLSIGTFLHIYPVFEVYLFMERRIFGFLNKNVS